MCTLLGDAVSRVPARLGRDAIARTPCVWDSFWESGLEALPRAPAIAGRYRQWLVRWSVFARLVRLGYNVLCVDADAVLLARCMLPSYHPYVLCVDADAVLLARWPAACYLVITPTCCASTPTRCACA